MAVLAKSRVNRIGAAIDVGSNSNHLLVARVDPPATLAWRGLRVILDQSELLGLGDVVDAHGEVPAEARARLVASLSALQLLATAAGAQRLTLIGTEPLRRAANARTLAGEVRVALGHELHIVTVEQEALLTFLGVTGGRPPAEPLIVVDIGGGSTEVSVYTPGEGIHVAALAIGSARLTNAVVAHDPPTDDELGRLHEAAEKFRRELPDQPPASKLHPARAVFVGGTATNVARLSRLSRAALAEDRRTLARMTAAQVTEHFGVKPRRARQLAAGAAIVDVLLEHYKLEHADVSQASLRDGAVIAEFRHGDAWPDHLAELVTVE